MSPSCYYHRIRFWYQGQLITFSFFLPRPATFLKMKSLLYSEIIDQGLTASQVNNVRFFINKKSVYALSTQRNFPSSPS